MVDAQLPGTGANSNASCKQGFVSALNIHGDHSDSMGARDSGWIQLYSENAQEAYDNTIQAFRIAENMDIRLPVMVCFDGFIISHSIERVEYIDDKDVENFVGEYEQMNPLLDMDNPKSYGPLILPDLYMEYKRAQHEVMTKVKDVVLNVADDFEKLSKRKYGLFETYRLDDSDIAIVILNSAAGTAKDVIDQFRAKGIKAGLLKPRLFRPFPYEEVADAIKNVKSLCVMGRRFFWRIRSSFYRTMRSCASFARKAMMINKIYGLVRDFMPEPAGCTK